MKLVGPRCFVVLFAAGLLCAAGCYATATKAQVDEQVQRLQGNSLSAKLVFVRSDDHFDYYRIEDLSGNLLERYRVPRENAAAQ